MKTRNQTAIQLALVTLMILFSTACASADVTTVRQNLDKYWAYRSMQRSYFVVVGTGQGRSMPACWRNLNEQQMNWGDGTIDLGWYIGALATEHYMLSNPQLFPGYASGGGDMNVVRNELQYALAALDRVDATGEQSLQPGAPDTPGFFIRDDVPDDFYTHFPGMNNILSDYTNPDWWAKEMSQDQVCHVLLGVSLVKKLIPSDLVVNGMNLRSAAVERGAEIIDWVHQHGWIIYDPVHNIPVNRGEDARAYSKGFSKACIYLTDGAVNFDSSVSGFYSWVWDTLSSPSNPGYDNYNNRHMAMVIAACGSGWGSGTLDSLMSLADAYDWYAYPMLYAVLHDSTAQSQGTWAGHQATIGSVVQNQLNLAPASGPHEPIVPEEENTGWCADRKFIRDLNSQNHGGSTDGHQYPGLDYLVLHNLFYIVTPSLWQDPSSPGEVAGFSVTSTSNQNSLSWTNPSRSDFVGTMIRYRTDTFPVSPTDGVLLCDRTAAPGSGDSFVHSGLYNGTAYYYSAFTYNNVPVYSAAVNASGSPVGPRMTISANPFPSIDGWSISLWKAEPTAVDAQMFWSVLVGRTGGGIRCLGGGITDNTERCLREGGEIRKTVSTTGYENIQVSYDLFVNSLGGSYTGAGTGGCAVDHNLVDEQLTVFYSTNGGATWNEAEYVTRTTLLGYQSWGTRQIDLSGIPACRDNPDFTLRFRWQLNSELDLADLDNITITGTTLGILDQTPPGPVTGFAAVGGDQLVNLSWSNPADSDFVGTMVRYKTSGYPTSRTDGTLLCDKTAAPGSNDSFSHIGLAETTTYYYSAFAHDGYANYSAKSDASALTLGGICFDEAFPYTNGNLSGRGGWSTGAGSEMYVVDETVRITGGAGVSYVSKSVSCIPVSGMITVLADIRAGTGTATMWGLWIDDPQGRNLARWYGSGTTVRGRIAGTSAVTASFVPLAGPEEWDRLEVRINTIADTSQFLVNGINLGMLSHASQSPSDMVGAIRLERIDNNEAANQTVFLDNIALGSFDSTPPGPVTGFSATRGNGQVTLNWINPGDPDFAGCKIRFKTNGYPINPADGTLIYTGAATSYLHTGLTNGVTYYYCAYAFDETGNYSVRAQASATPADTIAPANVSGFSAIRGNTRNTLIWNNPGTADFVGTTIRFKTSGYPTGPTDGTLLVDKAGSPSMTETYVHVGVTNGVTYYYRAYSRDAIPNYASGAGSSASPDYVDPYDAKILGDFATTVLTEAIVSASFDDMFYAQCSDKPLGIRVIQIGHSLAAGQVAGVRGTVLTDPDTDEKFIFADWSLAHDAGQVSPMAMNNASVGGVAWSYDAGTGAGQKGLTSASGPNNTGLLVRVWGKVTQRQTTEPKYFYVDDGAGLRDGTTTGSVDNVGVRVLADPAGYAESDFVLVTGVSSCFKNGTDLRPLILPAVGGIEKL